MAIIRNRKVKKVSSTYGQNAGKAGIVYILCEMVNHHKMGKRKTDLYKIGESTHGGKVRAQQLSDDAKKEGSNVYYEFITEIATSDCYKTEQLVFKKLEEFREGNFWEDGGHEFFKFNNEEQVQHAIKVIRETCVEIDSKSNQENWLDELIAWADKNNIPDYYLNDEMWYGFPRDKKNILAITELNLCKCELTKLPESIGNLTNLTWLDLQNNQLTEIPESIGKLTNLRCLYLTSNKLMEIPESIGKLTDLTVLFLSRNQLTEIPEFIGKLTNLTELDLRGNQLTKLPESIGNLTNLTWLGLSNNQLTKSPESISKLTKLDLSDNPIKSLPSEPLQIIPVPKKPEVQHLIKVIPDPTVEVHKSGVKNFFKILFSVFTQTVETVEHISSAVNTAAKLVDEAAKRAEEAATKAHAEQVAVQEVGKAMEQLRCRYTTEQARLIDEL